MSTPWIRRRIGLAGGIAGLTVCLSAMGCAGKSADLPPPEEPTTASAPVDEPPPNADMSCGLKVIATPPTEILIDGKSIGMSPATKEKIAPGVHEVTFVDDENGNVTLEVTLQPGEFQVVSHNMPPKATETGPAKE